MKLRGIDFGPCWDASGLRNFFGEGWWYHRLAPFWYDFAGSTRVAKTTTMHFQKGNMPLSKQGGAWHPDERFPRCIYVDMQQGLALNAVALSGPGFQALVDEGLLEGARPFMISFMSVATTPQERMDEYRLFAKLLRAELLGSTSLRKCLGLQINLSCPNTGHDMSAIMQEALEILSIVGELGIPVVVKINALAPIEFVSQLASHQACDGICGTNTIPFGSDIPAYLGSQIAWKELFPHGSPLKQFAGGGGLSGKPLLPLTINWVRTLFAQGITKPISAGGGILGPDDVDRLVSEAGLRRGIDSVSIGSIAMLRPWRIKKTIRHAHKCLGWYDQQKEVKVS